MKEAIGGLSVFQIVILFILIFTGVMCLTINHSKAYGVKDEMVNILQDETYDIREDLVDTGLGEEIATLLTNAGYRITGNCPDGFQGYKVVGDNIETATRDASFCIKKVDVAENYDLSVEKVCNGECSFQKNTYPQMYYYQVCVFYQLDIPILNEFVSFKSYASTKIMYGARA